MGGGEEMNIDPADACSIQMFCFDEMQYLIVFGGNCCRQSPQ